MKIKSKLLLINTGLLLSFFLSIGIYAIMQIPSNRIEREKEKLSELEKTVSQYKSLVNLTPFSLYSSHLEKLQLLGDETLKKFEEVSELEYLRNSSEAVESALYMIEKVDEVIKSSQKDLLDGLKIIEKEAVQVFGSTSGFKIMDFYSKREAKNFGRIDRIHYDIEQLLSDIISLDYSISSSLKIIQEQSVIIDYEISRLRQRSLVISFLIITVLVITVVFMVVLLSNKIGKSITDIVRNIISMKEGDLTVRFLEKSKDDIGLLCRDLNLFQANLSESIKNIQQISNENISVQKDLIVAVKQTDENSTDIDRNASEIAGKIDELKANIDVSSYAVDQVDKVFSTLNNQVTEQMAMVEESTASVTEMISSIDSIARITESKTQAIKQLVKTSANGSERLNETTGIINEINDKIDNISQMASIIKGIANQTNLLAMNAAIEAAHAGDSGRGFAVVADEIRKLAEASSKQSNEISSNLKEIVENIENAQASGSVTNLAYSEVDKEITLFSQSLFEISTSISELKSGGEQILEAMTSLQDVSINVKNSSNDLSEASDSMKREMGSVNEISQEVQRKISDVSIGIGEVSQSVNSINGLARSVGAVTENLNREVSQFKTEDIQDGNKEE